MVNEVAIQEAIIDLKSQKAHNFAATAKKHSVPRLILTRRFKGETVSSAEAHSRHYKLMTNAQESVLIEHIRKLSDRDIHPTSQILENLVVEFVGKHILKCWVFRFLVRYENEFTSVYLRNID